MQPTGSGATQDQRTTIVEIMGYTGTAIALVGTGAVVGSFTSGGRGVTLLVSLLLAAALFVAGLVVGAAAIERLQRMQSVLWFLSVGAFQAFAGALVEPSSKVETFLVLALTGAAAAALWFLLRRSLQQVALYGALLGAILVLVTPEPTFGVFSFLGGFPDVTVTAILSMLVGGGWLTLGLFGLITPPRTAMVLGSITVLVGALILASELEEGAFLLMAVVGAALLAIGNMRADRAVSGIGIVGLLLGAAVFFSEIVSGDAGSIIALVVGVGILLAAILLGRSWGAVPAELPSLGDITPPPQQPPASPSA
jgi:hypothetical protein